MSISMHVMRMCGLRKYIASHYATNSERTRTHVYGECTQTKYDFVESTIIQYLQYACVLIYLESATNTKTTTHEKRHKAKMTAIARSQKRPFFGAPHQNMLWNGKRRKSGFFEGKRLKFGQFFTQNMPNFAVHLRLDRRAWPPPPPTHTHTHTRTHIPPVLLA